jgi:hypothetical protein
MTQSDVVCHPCEQWMAATKGNGTWLGARKPHRGFLTLVPPQFYHPAQPKTNIKQETDAHEIARKVRCQQHRSNNVSPQTCDLELLERSDGIAETNRCEIRGRGVQASFPDAQPADRAMRTNLSWRFNLELSSFLSKFLYSVCPSTNPTTTQVVERVQTIQKKQVPHKRIAIQKHELRQVRCTRSHTALDGKHRRRRTFRSVVSSAMLGVNEQI